MTDTTLAGFVKEALSAGASPADVETALVEAGWSSEQIRDALSAYSAVKFVVPVPLPRSHLSARDTFFYLVMFAMLYLSTYQFGNLLFQFINLALPDPVFEFEQEYATTSIRFATASVVVAFPLFLYMASLVNKRIRKEPAQRLSAIRKWLTYLTLAIAACIIVGDLIYLLNSLLSGELTSRIILKALVVGSLSAGIFAYYLNEMRTDDRVL